ncbi:MAG: DUF1887 family protein [Oscillospiraceae bacterium]|nr:DUF1887 family protein [Oscillospiraceae bacterium]
MKTLIELYDERPIENVLGTEMFHPLETILLCPPEMESAKTLKKSLEKYFAHRGCKVRLTIVPVSLLDASKVEKSLRQILEKHSDCAIDISGGTDASLFAAGAVCAQTAVFTYSRKRNAFYEIKNAPFARDLPCTVQLDAESCFLMAGGTLLPGREDNKILRQKLSQIDCLFAVFRQFRKIWNRQICYIQKISSSEPGKLEAAGSKSVKADHGTVTVNEELLRKLEKSGLINNLQLADDMVSFRFPDETVRFWLRDIGAVLELQVYRACLSAQCFNDVVLSAVVNWEGSSRHRETVSNEIDVMAVQGIQPVFISCKTSEIRTEALNELAILRDRFGGKGSRAIIVTSSPASRSRAVTRMRAAKLGIEVIEWNDLPLERLVSRLTIEGFSAEPPDPCFIR